MNLKNDSYIIYLESKNFTEKYFREKDGWVKISARGRKFKMTAEQVINHLLPALAGLKAGLKVRIDHND